MIYPSNPENIGRAAALIRAGELVVMPTETVYGLAANALDESAVRRIFAAKGRPASNPLIVHVGSLEMARSLAGEWPEDAQTLAERFWPGPLTIVVPKQSSVPDIVTAGLPSVALRHPAHLVAQALLANAELPVAAPSANRFTELSPTTAQHVPEELASMILDGGPCTVGIESTVISLVDGARRILRPGMVSRAAIEKVIGPAEVGAGGESPGQHQKHYSPRTPVFLGARPSSGNGVQLDFALMPCDPTGYAETLYRTLHDLDRRRLDWIAIEPPPDTPEWDAVHDRLRRAAYRSGRDS
jgi:L-threonylcarbamoyladenylate synthase